MSNDVRFIQQNTECKLRHVTCAWWPHSAADHRSILHSTGSSHLVWLWGGAIALEKKHVGTKIRNRENTIGTVKNRVGTVKHRVGTVKTVKPYFWNMSEKKHRTFCESHDPFALVQCIAGSWRKQKPSLKRKLQSFARVTPTKYKSKQGIGYTKAGTAKQSSTHCKS